MKSWKKLALGLSAVGGTLLPFLSAHAAADATLVNAVGDISTAAKDNVTGVMSNALFVAFVGLILSIGIVWAIVKKFRRA